MTYALDAVIKNKIMLLLQILVVTKPTVVAWDLRQLF
jgi:hypothetical protein